MRNKFLFFIIVSIFYACIYTSTTVREADKSDISKKNEYEIKSPTKAHLDDGSVIIYDKGFKVKNDTITSFGKLYNFNRTNIKDVKYFPLDSVQYLEYYPTEFDGLAFVASIPGAILGSAIGLVAIFGSCPTIYSPNIEKDILEAECFSYSISPRYEADDLDRLEHPKIKDNKLNLLLTNEALETHYINELSILTVSYPDGYTAYPTEENEIVLFGKVTEISEAQDKSGRNVISQLSLNDSSYYQSTSNAHSPSEIINRDHIDLTIANPQYHDEMVLVLRLRNTLLNTVLLYDMMLVSQGVQAIDWIGHDSQSLFYAWKLHSWYEKHFGMDIELNQGTALKKLVILGFRPDRLA